MILATIIAAVSSWGNWFVAQSLAVQALTVVGGLNIFVAGAKQMGWTYLADQCQKIENAIQAMLKANATSLKAKLCKPKVVSPTK